MIKYAVLFALFISSFSFALDKKPHLHLYLCEQEAEGTDTEVMIITEFQNPDPATQPYASLLGVAETFSQAASTQGKGLSIFFKETDQPRDLINHISQMDKTVQMKFIIPEQSVDNSLRSLLNYVQHMPSQVGNIDRLVHEEIKSEFINYLPELKKSEHQVSKELVNQLFEMLPVDSLNEFMEESFIEANTHLIIAYPKGNSTIKQMIAMKTDELSTLWQVEKHDSAPAMNNLNAKTIAKNGPGYVVDGKIYMDPPGWWQQEVNGTSVGLTLIIASFVFAIFTFGISLFALGIPGIILLVQAYPADPVVIERTRVEIFNKGYYFAHNEQCVSYTLTPYERRKLFVQDIFKRNLVFVTKLSDFSAYYVLKAYNYNAIEMRQFLYTGETDQLRLFQSNFNRSVDSISQQIKDLKAELNRMLTPYQTIRDADVKLANSDYEHCAVVELYNEYINAFEDEKKYVESEWRKGNISMIIRDGKIRDLKDTLELQLASLEGALREAETILARNLAAIQAQYELNVIGCKNAINYDAKMDTLKKGEWEVMSYYSNLAAQYIMQQMNPDDRNFEDILDLRVKK